MHGVIYGSGEKTWTDERVERLKLLLANGRSASQIAADLGDITRSAVLGKIHRLGLSKPRIATRIRDSVSPRGRRNGGAIIAGVKAARKREAAKQGAIALMATEATSLPAETIAHKPVALLDLEPHHCRFPISVDADKTIGFCGAACVEHLPYCVHHAGIAYTKWRL